MDTLLNRLQIKLLPNIGGILWITKNPLHERPEGFPELDYFFNYMLSNYLLTNKESDQSFFSTTAFDKSMFLGHFIVDSKNLQTNMGQILKIGGEDLTKRSVLLLGKEHIQKNFNSLKSKNSEINFIKFTLD